MASRNYDDIQKFEEKYLKKLKVSKEKILDLKEHRKQYFRQYRIKNKDKFDVKRIYLQSLKPKKIKKIYDESYYEEQKRKKNEKAKLYRLKNIEEYNISARNRYWRDKEKYKERIRKYISKNKENFQRQQKEYALNFPEKTKARYLYTLEKVKGNVKNLPCEKCGAIKTHAHHDDYNKPLDVRYLCPKHHHEFHREHIYDAKTYTYIKKNDIIRV